MRESEAVLFVRQPAAVEATSARAAGAHTFQAQFECRHRPVPKTSAHERFDCRCLRLSGSREQQTLLAKFLPEPGRRRRPHSTRTDRPALLEDSVARARMGSQFCVCAARQGQEQSQRQQKRLKQSQCTFATGCTKANAHSKSSLLLLPLHVCCDRANTNTLLAGRMLCFSAVSGMTAAAV